MKNKPKVSVAIITRNHENFIADTLKSVLEQKTNFPFEIIIGDDCSMDATRFIIRKIAENSPHKFVFLFYDEVMGSAANCMSVYQKCSGEYIAQLDGDDLMLPGKLQKQVDFLEAHPECSACSHSMMRLHQDGHLSPPKKIWRKKLNNINDLLIHQTFIAHSSKMFRKSAMPPEGFDCSVKVIVDFLWHMQNMKYGLIGYLEESLGIYRVGVGVTSSNKKNIKWVNLSICDRVKAVRYGLKIGGGRVPYVLGLMRSLFYGVRAYWVLIGRF